MKYVVLLRGVNVSGKNRVPKIDFQTVLEKLGFDNVSVYLNSGNALFTSEEQPSAEQIQTALETHFGFSVPTLLFSSEQFNNIFTCIPKHWTYDSPNSAKKGNFSHVIFLFDKVNALELIENTGYNPEKEKCISTSGAILHTVGQKYWTKSLITKLMYTKTYDLVSIRNVNTVRKLSELLGE